MSVLIAFIIFYLLTSFTLGKLFAKAGIDSWKAYVPGLNFFEWAGVIGRSKWHALWLLFPIVNIFIFAGMAIDLVKSFGRFSFFDSVLAVIGTPIIFYQIGQSKDAFLGPNFSKEKAYKQQILAAKKNGNKKELQQLIRKNPYQKSGAREWAESIIFAVFAAAFIRMFLIEAYTIPTPSMEGSLLVGDFLFVSKAHYGIRTPMTVLQVPLLHNRMPYANTESYLKKPSLNYHRFKALEKVERNKPVVFNYPEGDSVYITPNRTYGIYDVRRANQLQEFNRRYSLTVRPIDKKDHYIKRCIGIGGDTIQVKSRQVFINGKPVENPSKMQFDYRVTSVGAPINPKAMEAIGITDQGKNGVYSLTNEQVEKLKGLSPNIIVEVTTPQQPFPGYLYPHDTKIVGNWTMDNYGPVIIPKEGMTIDLNSFTYAFYDRVIRVYEGNDLEVKNGAYYVNGQQATQYTFRQNYFWMMGDNRHNSEDSRVWGFVPEDHIVGKPLFIWMSLKNASLRDGVRWDRIFKSASVF